MLIKRIIGGIWTISDKVRNKCLERAEFIQNFCVVKYQALPLKCAISNYIQNVVLPSDASVS